MSVLMAALPMIVLIFLVARVSFICIFHKAYALFEFESTTSWEVKLLQNYLKVDTLQCPHARIVCTLLNVF